jgi:hypothetical protein
VHSGDPYITDLYTRGYRDRYRDHVCMGARSYFRVSSGSCESVAPRVQKRVTERVQTKGEFFRESDTSDRYAIRTNLRIGY